MSLSYKIGRGVDFCLRIRQIMLIDFRLKWDSPSLHREDLDLVILRGGDEDFFRNHSD
jgi:hypothetical protein